MKINNIRVHLPSPLIAAKILVITILLVYSLIPFEGDDQTLTLAIRCTSAALIICGMLKWRFSVKKFYIPYLIVVIGFVVISALISFSFKLVVILVALSFGIVWSQTMVLHNKYVNVYSSAIAVLIYISIGCLFVQLLMYRVGGQIIGFHEIVFPMSISRTEDHGMFARLGGMYVEPGTYANWVYALYVLLILSTKRQYLMTGLLVGISLVMTVSVWGIGVGVAMAIISLFLTDRISWVWKFVVGILLISIMSYYLSGEIGDYALQKLRFESDSGMSKIVALEEFEGIWKNILFFGKGFDPNFCVSCLAPQDAGLYISISVIFGILFASLFFLVIFFTAYKTGGLLLLALMVPLSLSKIFYWDFLLWMIAFMLIANFHNKKAQN